MDNSDALLKFKRPLFGLALDFSPIWSDFSCICLWIMKWIIPNCQYEKLFSIFSNILSSSVRTILVTSKIQLGKIFLLDSNCVFSSRRATAPTHFNDFLEECVCRWILYFSRKYMLVMQSFILKWAKVQKGHEMPVMMVTIAPQNQALWYSITLLLWTLETSIDRVLLITELCSQQLLIDWDIKRNKFVSP